MLLILGNRLQLPNSPALSPDHASHIPGFWVHHHALYFKVPEGNRGFYVRQQREGSVWI